MALVEYKEAADDYDVVISRQNFPKDFVFGSASSAYQYEGAAQEGGKAPSIWDTFTERTPGKVVDGSNGYVALDFYHRYKEDIANMKRIGFKAFRFSISWPRVLPGGVLSAGKNEEGIQFYNDLINELLANGIEPFVTLFHWDVPQVLEDEYGGFLSPRIVADYCNYAELCFWEFGDRVKNWITFNEPHIFINFGYVTGTMAPGRGPTRVEHHKNIKKDGRFPCWNPVLSSNGDPGTEPYLVAHNLLLAHATAVQLYRNKFQTSQDGKIGITLDQEWAYPLDDKNSGDVEAVNRYLDFTFGWLMEPLSNGHYPKIMRELVKDRLPRFSQDESSLLKRSYDFIGLNYYTSSYATTETDPNPEHPSYGTDMRVTNSSERNGKPIGVPGGMYGFPHTVPDGLYKLLLYIKRKYSVPVIYITENGYATASTIHTSFATERHDALRIKYHNQHLYAILKGIEDGVNVKGYFIWTLMDTFEWANGFTVRFGIIYADYKHGLKRYAKDSAIWFMKLLKEKNDLPIFPTKRRITESNENSLAKKPKNM